MRAAVLLLGAGRGERMAASRPKAFVPLAGKTFLERAVETVEACPDVDGFVVAAPRGWEPEAEAISRASGKHIAVVRGTDSRQGSVAAALRRVPEGFDVVLCHDVARPLASPKLFSAVLAPLDRAEGVVPVLPVVETIKRMRDGHVVETIPREGLVLVQTPQAFRHPALVDAHRRGADAGWVATDDAALLEWAGRRVATVPGEPTNLKITRPEDLRVAEVFLRADD